jgi:hypothetical protein
MQLKAKASDTIENSLRFSGQNFSQVTLSPESYQDFPTLMSTLDSITTFQIFRLPLRVWWDYKNKI